MNKLIASIYINKFFKTITVVFCAFSLCSCASKKISDISYLKESKALVASFPKLNVYQTRKSKDNPVVIFIHGGYWNEGRKGIYGFLGRNFAKKDVVTIIPNYTLSPNGNYNTMAKEVAAAIKWTHENIEKYNGNPDQIFLMGHSAGGHLIALVGTNPKYLEDRDIVKGIILNDAAGLDMYSYLKKYPPTKNHNYDVTWTGKEENWKDASPIYFVSEKTPPIFMITGTKTFPSIISQNKGFLEKLNKFQPNVKINFQSKKHIPMMRQFFWPWNKNYKEILEFIDIHK
ncbi:alpha/beta hydrolase [Polaribacter sp. IC073]|uniref:alpha/beta hydrolase n=1 Tax=Polaribacter sp. IC073 TaxID=2508540 RepID=UPI0011BE4AFE|nr:alpha/beta hydrolase [Polaribacter sp. IC073]TXD47720.1 alpha/beta hydrolase [Polaribacter sp. IC073]